MASIGETRVRFNRSYIFLNPEVNGELGVGTWRLTGNDIASSSGEETSTLNEEITLASDSPAVLSFQLIYIDSANQARLADASSAATAAVAGITISAGNPGDLITYTRNRGVSITNVSSVVDGAPSALEAGKYYFLSATNPGNLTRTPDTSTDGAVLVQVGIAVSSNELLIEIQTPLII